MQVNHEPLMEEVEASIGICNEKVLVHCCYEGSCGYPTIYKVMFDGVDIQGCLSGEAIDELEIYTDEVLKRRYEIENYEFKIAQWETDQLYTN